VEELTGFPECLGGRVKTLHPAVHAGLLADQRLDQHRAELAELGVEPFDLLVSNLYPFTETVAAGGDVDACVEQIDIGGPAMVRAAAKNHHSVAGRHLARGLPDGGGRAGRRGLTLDQRRVLAARAFADIAAYDVAVAEWCAQQLTPPEDWWPDFAGLSLTRAASLRYGENPHQRPRSTSTRRRRPGWPRRGSWAAGKCPTTTTWTRTRRGGRCTTTTNRRWPSSSTPTRAASRSASNIATAYRLAHACDPISAYGGVIAANRVVDEAMAREVAEVFTEVIVAPGYADEAFHVLSARKNLRILVAPEWTPATVEYRQISGGTLTQTADRVDAPGDDPATWQLAAGPAASSAVLADLAFAWRAVRAVKSNAILLAHGGAAVGVGMGQVNRVDSARLAVARAGRPGGRVGGRVGRVLPVPGRPGDPDRGRRCRGRPARWLGARRAGHRGRREGRRQPVPHRNPPLLPLRIHCGPDGVARVVVAPPGPGRRPGRGGSRRRTPAIGMGPLGRAARTRTCRCSPAPEPGATRPTRRSPRSTSTSCRRCAAAPTCCRPTTTRWACRWAGARPRPRCGCWRSSAWRGVRWTTCAAAVKSTLDSGAALDPAQLKDRLGDQVRNLGEEGRKKGQSTTLPAALGLLQAAGEIRRVPDQRPPRPTALRVRPVEPAPHRPHR
jgi:phosphoribosylaminoimidazolecarboxamide formyltransferase/IMP cyclohydrolase